MCEHRGFCRVSLTLLLLIGANLLMCRREHLQYWEPAERWGQTRVYADQRLTTRHHIGTTLYAAVSINPLTPSGATWVQL